MVVTGSQITLGGHDINRSAINGIISLNITTWAIPGLSGLLGGIATATSQYFANKDKGDREKRATQADETPVETSPADALTKDVDGGVVDRKKEAEQSMASDKIDFNKPIDPDNMTEAQTKALQEKIGATADGKWGKNSMAKLNTYYRDNGIVPPNAKALDQALSSSGIEVKELRWEG